MEGRADDFGIVLVKVVSLVNTPSRIGDLIIQTLGII